MKKTRKQLKQDKKKLEIENKDYINQLHILSNKLEGWEDIEETWVFLHKLKEEIEKELLFGKPDWSRADDSDPRYTAVPLIKDGDNKCGEPVVPYEGQKCLEATNNYGLKIDKSFVSDALNYDIEGYIGAPGKEGVSTVYYEFEMPITGWRKLCDGDGIIRGVTYKEYE